MQLFIGGAFAGKRKIVRNKYQNISWVTAYEEHIPGEWMTRWKDGKTLVAEGWEKWIADRLTPDAGDDEIRNEFQQLLDRILEEERRRNGTVALIMLEVGRGIVPVDSKDRRLRDLAGWVLQDAAERSEGVSYVWHGLERRLK